LRLRNSMRRPVAVLAFVALLAFSSLSAAPPAKAKNVTFVIEMRNFTFSPDFLQVDPGDNVTIVVFNNETVDVPHTFDLDASNIHLGTVSDPMRLGENRTATFTVNAEGTFYFHCAIPGHATNQGGGRWAGMAGRLQVGEAPPPADLTPIIVAGVVVLAMSLAAVVYVARRGKEKEKSP